ncbi:integral membrane protein GPR155 [Hyalella azteca]|uniref:Integral membrane protein GPR155 n=1 Tax=Hyalella azteca TaxID=294128 RepID=A0A8B7PMB2_HYAAZ|nr:integral membrane protein GPR155 [Hyalella azteca]
MLRPMSRFLPACLMVIILSLTGLCLSTYFSSNYNGHGHVTVLKTALCKGVFHYGFMSLPMACYELIDRPTSGGSEGIFVNGILISKEYSQPEYLTDNATLNPNDEKSLKAIYHNKSMTSRGIVRAMAETTLELPDSGSSEADQDSSVDFSNLYIAVIQCFAIILCGYVAGRSNIISQTEAKGLNTFVSYFSLPALIFLSLAKLDFSSVNWLFLCSICLAKSVVFVLVAIITLLVHRPTDFSKAGLYAIFCTQSNDFALGYPIVKALYGVTHPDYPSYLYLLAPISLVFLNPVGFVLMEAGKNIKAAQRNKRSSTANRPANSLDSDNISCSSDATSSTTTTTTSSEQPLEISNVIRETRNMRSSFKKFQFLRKTIQGILLNPVVTMSILGIVCNVLFKHHLPQLLEGTLSVLGQAFSASALFALGVRMVGQVAALRGSSLVVPGILIAVKTLMLPLVCREFVSLLKPGGDNLNVTKDYGNYGFLYGTFPTAPSVFVFASHYNIQPDLMASSMVAVTFLSAPLMLVSAKMVALVHINPLYYVSELETFLLQVSLVGLIASLWVVVVFLLCRKWRQVPHCITLCLAASQCIASLGALLWSVLDCTQTWQLYLQFCLVTFGVFSSRFFTALLAATLFLLRWRSLSFVLSLRPVLLVIGWGVPGVLVLVLVMVVQREMDLADKQDLNFQYGTTQAVVALLLLWFTLFTTIVCLILQQRQQKRYEPYSSLADAQSPEDVAPLNRQAPGDDEGIGHTVSDGSDVEVTSSDSDSLFSPTHELRPASGGSKHHRLSPRSHSLLKPRSFATASNKDEDIPATNSWEDTNQSCKVLIGEDPESELHIPDGQVHSMSGAETETIRRHPVDVVTSNADSHSYSENISAGPTNIHEAPSGDSLYRQYQPHTTRLTIPQESSILRDRDDEFQMMRHVVLLLFLCGSMIVGFGLCLWTLVSDDVSGVYIEMVFLDAVLNYGQGLITAAIFGLDSTLIVLPLMRWYRRVRYGTSTVQLPPLSEVSAEHLQICEQFTRYHMDQCCRDIVRNRQWRLQKLKSVFAGQELVDWLLMVGLSNDRTHAVRYGRALLTGRVIHHINDAHHFHDQPLFYSFCHTSRNAAHHLE